MKMTKTVIIGGNVEFEIVAVHRGWNKSQIRSVQKKLMWNTEQKSMETNM